VTARPDSAGTSTFIAPARSRTCPSPEHRPGPADGGAFRVAAYAETRRTAKDKAYAKGPAFRPVRWEAFSAGLPGRRDEILTDAQKRIPRVCGVSLNAPPHPGAGHPRHRRIFAGLALYVRTDSTSTPVWEAFGGERRAGMFTSFDSTRVSWDDWTQHGQRRI
jgi:hypothetical protein